MPNQEKELLCRAQAGDVEAFESLVSIYQPAVFRLALAATGNPEDAEDALQETLIQAYRALPGFRGDAALSTWLYRIALNAARNWIRSQSRASSDRFNRRLAYTSGSARPQVESELLARERRRLLREAVHRLPVHYREAILLRHYEDMPYEQIAKVLHVPLGTVRSRLAKGRQLLLADLEQTGCFDTE